MLSPNVSQTFINDRLISGQSNSRKCSRNLLEEISRQRELVHNKLHMKSFCIKHSQSYLRNRQSLESQQPGLDSSANPDWFLHTGAMLVPASVLFVICFSLANGKFFYDKTRIIIHECCRHSSLRYENSSNCNINST